MARSFGSKEKAGGGLIEELRRLELMRETGALTEAAYLESRVSLMQSVSDAVVVGETPAPPPVATAAGRSARIALASLALGLAAMLGATPEALICVSLAGFSMVGFAAACLDE